MAILILGARWMFRFLDWLNPAQDVPDLDNWFDTLPAECLSAEALRLRCERIWSAS